MMRRLVPQWIWQMPFGEAISPVFVVALLIATVGVGLVLSGVLLKHLSYVFWGIVCAIPFIFFAILLWRTYQDDGYNR